MAEDTYEAPGIEDRTPVSEPLNTLTNSEQQQRTPAWRTEPTDSK